MNKESNADMIFITDLESVELTRNFIDLNIKIGGTLGKIANHWKEEIKKWEIKDVADFISKLQIDNATLPVDLKSYLVGLDEKINSLGIDLKNFSNISLDKFFSSQTERIKLIRAFPPKIEISKTPFEEIFAKNLGKHFLTLNPKIVEQGYCAALVGMAIVIVAHILKANADKYDELADHLINTASVVAPAVCAYLGGV
ncbi:hypothetical protein ACIQXZ_29740 [Bacillus thuringiensis]|uniref:hypothetical protein n=1 Tax=Bacillus cereus group TaxID=86661 RepID=UPI0005CF2188|nr:hypothetical protein [Bacillus cereus]